MTGAFELAIKIFNKVEQSGYFWLRNYEFETGGYKMVDEFCFS